MWSCTLRLWRTGAGFFEDPSDYSGCLHSYFSIGSYALVLHCLCSCSWDTCTLPRKSEMLKSNPPNAGYMLSFVDPFSSCLAWSMSSFIKLQNSGIMDAPWHAWSVQAIKPWFDLSLECDPFHTTQTVCSIKYFTWDCFAFLSFQHCWITAAVICFIDKWIIQFYSWV